MALSTLEEPASGPGSAGALFSTPGLLFVAVVAGACAWQGYDLPILFASTILVLILLVRFWSRAALMKISYRRQLESYRAFPGDTVKCDCTIDNRKPLPLVWVDILDRIPDAIMPEADDLPDGFAKTDDGLSLSTALLWYQKASWVQKLRCRRRGYFPLGRTLLTSGDLFGLLPRSRQEPTDQILIVYPRIFDLGQLGLPTRAPLGELRLGNPLYTDPLLFRGLRDYAPEIPLRHIHWKATARTGILQAKTFDPSSTLKAVIVLDASSYSDVDEQNTDARFEQAISAAASVAAYLIRSGITVGFAANAMLAGGGSSIAIAPKAGLDHLSVMLESMAKITRASLSFGPFLKEAESLFAAGTSIVVVTGGLEPSARVRLARLRRRGHPISLLLVGDSAPDEPSLPCQRITAPLAGWSQ